MILPACREDETSGYFIAQRSSVAAMRFLAGEYSHRLLSFTGVI
jgi:hypothetical protein